MSVEAVFYRGVGDVALENVPESKFQRFTHAVVRSRTIATYSPESHDQRAIPRCKEGRISLIERLALSNALESLFSPSKIEALERTEHKLVT
jgi:hypothetical protein